MSLPFLPSVKLAPQLVKAVLDDFLGLAGDSPHDGSIPLFVRDLACGTVFGPAVDCLRGFSFIRVDESGMHIASPDPAGQDSNEALALVAQRLRSEGHAPGWRNELLDVWSDSGDSIGGIERGVVRALGLTTKAVHLNGLSPEGHIWVARRALSKATDPGMWDTLVGGLVGLGEDLDLALVRESDEEAGLDSQHIAQRLPIRLVTRMHRRVREGFQREDVLTSECVIEPGITPQNRDGEVMEIACLTPELLLTMLEDRVFTVEASIVLADDLWRRCAR